MRLRTKLNLLLLVVGALGEVLFAIVSTPYLNGLAKDEVLQSSRIMMASATGARKYTSEQIEPLLEAEEWKGKRFYPQAVSAYAAVKIFEFLHAQFTDYSYRERALNPTNPMNRATDWESDIIQDFRAHPSQPESITIRETLTGPVMNLAQPIRAEERCLVCHTTPQAAPPSMLAAYGPDHGFGWKANEIIGAQIVSVPMNVAYDRAASVRYLSMAVYLGVLVVLAAVLNAGLALIVTGPVRTMSRIAEDVSLGRYDVPEFDRRGSNEIASLGQSLTRMRRSLEQALRLLSSPHRDPRPTTQIRPTPKPPTWSI